MGLLSLLAALLLGAPAAPAGSSPPPAAAVAPQISQWWTYEGETWVKSSDDEVSVEAPQDRVYWTGGFTGRPLP